MGLDGWSIPAVSGITVDNAPVTDTHSALGTSANYTGVNVTAGSGRMLVMTLVFEYAAVAPTGVAVAWDSAGTNQAMTLIKAGSATGQTLTQIWGLAVGDGGTNAQPTVGNGLNVAISWTNAANVFMCGISFQNADASTPFPNTASGTGAHTYPLTSSAGNKFVQAMRYTAGNLFDINLYTDSVTGTFINAAAGYGTTSAGSTTVGMSSGASNVTAGAAIEVH